MTWFARRFPVGHPSKAVAPVTWQGWVAAGAFIAGLLLAALTFAAVGIMFGMLWGVLAFLLLAAASGALFIIVAQRMGSQASTVEDVRNARDQ